MKITSFKKIFITALLVLSGYSFGPTVHAAQITFITIPAVPAVGEEFAITVQLNTQKDSLNVVEGSVSIPKDIFIEGVNTGGSGLSLWTVEPHFEPKTSSVEFTGGVPGGIETGKDITLFTIIAKASVSGTYMISSDSIHGFRNDGAGTEFPITVLPEQISVTTQASGAVQQKEDVTPPQFISVEVGQDQALFGGRYYLTFFATDDQSGVSYYEVKEGWFGRYVKADRYYVLSDQSRSSTIWVRAVDVAGNSTVEKISSQHPVRTIIYWGGGILIMLLAIVLVRYLRRQR